MFLDSSATSSMHTCTPTYIHVRVQRACFLRDCCEWHAYMYTYIHTYEGAQRMFLDSSATSSMHTCTPTYIHMRVQRACFLRDCCEWHAYAYAYVHTCSHIFACWSKVWIVSCDISVWHFCVTYLCDISVWCFCVTYLCDISVWHFFVTGSHTTACCHGGWQ